MKAPRVAVFSFADIDNYGDILFSWLVRHELRKRCPGAVVDFIAPAGCDLEGEHYEGYRREQVDGRYDGLILAGGEVVHFFDERTWEPIYERRGLSVPSGRASDVVWDWPSCEAGFKAWLSVGVRPFEDHGDPDRVESILDSLDFVSTRGVLSKKILEGGDYATADDRVRVTPDLGWLFPRLFPGTGAGVHPRALHGSTRERYAVFQFHNITDREAVEISTVLQTFRRATGLDVLLLPVIHLWNDREPMERIVHASGGEIMIAPGKPSPGEIAHLVMGAEVVMSSSLHVAITALAAGVPAAIFNKWPGTKFQDLFGAQMRSHLFIRRVEAIPAVLEELLSERHSPDHLRAYSTFMGGVLDRVFDEIARRLT